MISGFTARRSSTSMCNRVRASGRKLVRKTSLVRASSYSTSRALRCSSARPMLRFPRFGCSMTGWNAPSRHPDSPPIPRWASPVTACSTLITSAPQSASTAPAAGVKVNCATSRTRTPSIGRGATVAPPSPCPVSRCPGVPGLPGRPDLRHYRMYTAVPEGSVEYNPYSPATQHDPFPIYRWLRDEVPVYHNEKVGFWALSRYDDVLAASLDTDTYLSGHGMTIEGLDAGNDILINKDPPEHQWHRRLVSRVFTPMAVASQEPAIRDACRALLADARDRGRIDVIDDFSLQLPIAVICEMLGIPEDARASIHDRSSRMLAMSATDGPPVLSDDVVAASLELAVQMVDVVQERAAAPGDDIITLLLQSEGVDDNGRTWRLTPEQVASRVVELVVAGHETTAKLIGNLVAALAWYPGQRAALAADPSLAAAAVEEGLRWDGPSHYQGRWVERAVELHGVT